ncbi:hypothetical protein HY967_05080 [Candidatus Jorgensenbacteria bacterium]|nr:hypothetical protein [Candidatus Jorgensenbacteria bacterium]
MKSLIRVGLFAFLLSPLLMLDGCYTQLATNEEINSYESESDQSSPATGNDYFYDDYSSPRIGFYFYYPSHHYWNSWSLYHYPHHHYYWDYYPPDPWLWHEWCYQPYWHTQPRWTFTWYNHYWPNYWYQYPTIYRERPRSIRDFGSTRGSGVRNRRQNDGEKRIIQEPKVRDRSRDKGNTRIYSPPSTQKDTGKGKNDGVRERRRNEQQPTVKPPERNRSNDRNTPRGKDSNQRDQTRKRRP